MAAPGESVQSHHGAWPTPMNMLRLRRTDVVIVNDPLLIGDPTAR